MVDWKPVAPPLPRTPRKPGPEPTPLADPKGPAHWTVAAFVAADATERGMHLRLNRRPCRRTKGKFTHRLTKAERRGLAEGRWSLREV